MSDFEKLRTCILSCRQCQDLFGYEPQPVFQGHAHSKIFQISQAPSRSVHLTHKPFNDASGTKLWGEWYQLTANDFYNPDYFYITAMANCFPGKAMGGGDKKPPKICSEMWLEKQLKMVDNEIYLIIGRYAADYFFPKHRFDDLIFNDQVLRGKKAFVLPHPSPLNVKWFKDHPDFETGRMPVIRQRIHTVLGK